MHALVLALTLVGGPAPAADDVWPQWRGPTHDSVSPRADLPLSWSKTENVVWKTPLPGWGNSTPAIWKDALFVTTQDNDRLLLLRLNRVSGKVLWEREVGRGIANRKAGKGEPKYHAENNMASPSPVTDGKHVWAHFGNGDLACYDFDGEKVWSINFPKLYGPYSIWWGHSNSPLLVGDLLISVCIQDPVPGGKSYVVAHDKLTGKEKWYTPRDTGAKLEPGDSYTTPIPWTHGGRLEVLVFGGNVLDAYDPASGKQLWESKPFKGNRVISGPTLVGDTVYAVQGMKGPVFAIKVGGEGDTTATSVRWKSLDKTTPDAASPVVANGLVYLPNNEGLVTCVDAETGKEVWKERIGDAFRATPLVAGKRVYLFTKEGKCTIIEAAREFRVVGTGDVGEETIASPATTGGDLYVRTKQGLWRIGAKK
jgi:outer membrane protein assembly factor BamB